MTPTPKRVRVHHLREAKERGERLTMLTAYDAVTARIFDEAGIDMLLVGDSIGNTMHGHRTTLPVTVDDLIPPARAVAGAATRAFVVADLPFGSYEAGPEQALATAVRMMKETGVAAVKFEGGKRVAAQIKAITDAGDPRRRAPRVHAAVGEPARRPARAGPRGHRGRAAQRGRRRHPGGRRGRRGARDGARPGGRAASPRSCTSRRSASAPARSATGRCWSGWTWPG